MHFCRFPSAAALPLFFFFAFSLYFIIANATTPNAFLCVRLGA